MCLRVCAHILYVVVVVVEHPCIRIMVIAVFRIVTLNV